MILNSGAAGGGGLAVIASGARTIANGQDVNITLEKPAVVAFVVELQHNGTPCSICFPTGTTITSEYDTEFRRSANGKTLSISPRYADDFDVEYLALG